MQELAVALDDGDHAGHHVVAGRTGGLRAAGLREEREHRLGEVSSRVVPMVKVDGLLHGRGPKIRVGDRREGHDVRIDIDAGYCLMLGAGDASLLFDLLRQTTLTVYCIELPLHGQLKSTWNQMDRKHDLVNPSIVWEFLGMAGDCIIGTLGYDAANLLYPS